MSIRLRWLGVACFQIQLASGEVLIIDPYLDNSITAPLQAKDLIRADWIFITHGHFDHVLDVGQLANRLGSQVFCSAQVSRTIQERLSVPPNQIRVVTAGEIIKRGPLIVKVLRAIHVDNRKYFAEQLGLPPTNEMRVEEIVRQILKEIPDQSFKEKILPHLGKFPPGEQLNYIFDFPDNLRLYFLGSVPDRELFLVVEEARPQILILQLLRGQEKEAVELARRSGASIIFPSHHDPFLPGQKLPDMNKVRRLFAESSNIKFIEPLPGKWYEIKIEVGISDS